MASNPKIPCFVCGLLVALFAIEPDAVPGEAPAGAPGRARVTSRRRAAPAAAAGQNAASAKTGRIVPVQHETDDVRGSAGEQRPAEIPEALVASDGHTDPLAELLDQNITPIDLATALRLAGEQNPHVLLGQQHVVEAVALRQLAAARFLPTLNLG